MHIRSLSACAIFAVAALSPNIASAAPVSGDADNGLQLPNNIPGAPGGDVIPPAHIPIDSPGDDGYVVVF